MIGCATFVTSSLLGRIAEQGVANTLGLATLKHGTNAVSWLSIHLFGTLPYFGNTCVGGDYGKGYDRLNIGRTYFSYAHHTDTEATNDYSDKQIDPVRTTLITPKEYEFSSNCNL